MRTEPAARNTDPATSHRAAATMRTSGKAAKHREIVLGGVTAFPGMTAAELAREVGLDRYAVSRRLPELRDAGQVVCGPERTCAVLGSKSLTWRPAGPAVQGCLFDPGEAA